jgi:hypothetical protein
MEIIQESSLEVVMLHERHFWFEGHEKQWGYGFECEPDGTLRPLTPVQQERYAACLTGEVDGRKVLDGGVEAYLRVVRQPRIGRCVCGREVILQGFTCPCECGRDYDSAGNLLAPRECWGEETGETASDILLAEGRGFPEVDLV